MSKGAWDIFCPAVTTRRYQEDVLLGALGAEGMVALHVAYHKCWERGGSVEKLLLLDNKEAIRILLLLQCVKGGLFS
jgi:hypothetical protein